MQCTLVNHIVEQYLQHFQHVGLETHMYASQWFLTLFSAKFPLFLVFRVLDVFMLQGIDTIFQVPQFVHSLYQKAITRCLWVFWWWWKRICWLKTLRASWNISESTFQSGSGEFPRKYPSHQLLIGLRSTLRLWWRQWWGSRSRTCPSTRRTGGEKKRLSA